MKNHSLGSTIKQEDYKWFCPQPFINRVTASNRTVPCCVIKSWDPETDTAEKLREEMRTGDGEMCNRVCGVCVEQEKHPSPSHRQIYTSKWETGNYSEHLPKLEAAIKEPRVLTFEYQAPNNFCNLRCHMCGPGCSSSIAKENKDLGIETNFFKAHGKTLIKSADTENYDELLKGLIELKLTGGETLAISHNYDMMRRAVNLGVSKNIELTITTNATLTPKFDGKDIFDFIPHFKSCEIIVSIEMWGDKNDYIRYPSKWQTIYDNTLKFIQAPRTRVMFASCVSSLNVGYFDEIATGTHNMMRSYPRKFRRFASGSLVLNGESLYEVTAVPPTIREQYLDKYYSNTHPNYVQTFSKLCSYLENMKYSEELMWKMLEDVKKRDKHRGTCLTDVFPEWKPYYGRL